jgi:DNA replication and repair protein RecF
VRLIRLEPRGFRNLVDASTALGDPLTVFHGPNAAGKTNLLEAIHFGLAGCSCRTGNDREVIRFGAQTARVKLELALDDGTATVLSSIDRSGERRHRLDGRPLAAGDAERPLVSVFLPDRLQLVKGPPAQRRAHLDRFIARLWPARADLRLRFGRVLGQRNALVARIRAGEASPGSLPSWDEKLAAEAAALSGARAEAVQLLTGPFGEAAAALGLPGATLSYRPRVAGDATAIAVELARRRSRGLDRSYLMYGPHLDELELSAGGRSLRRFGSQGQQRIALLAFLFAERRVLMSTGRPAPLMLLDDVMSELDPKRRQLLVEALANAGQAVLTATEAAHVPSSAKGARIAVREGGTARLAEAA